MRRRRAKGVEPFEWLAPGMQAGTFVPLTPLDGRTALVRPVRLAPFGWDEDRDPPAGLREAQREHGRLREALLRDGLRRAGRRDRWFSRRFRPPGH
jgi:hypothetical protein